MDFNILISELRSSSEHLSSDSGDKSLLSSIYCNNACKALQRVTETDSDYESIITGLWLIVAHFAEQSGYLRPVPALSELCFKLFRQCAKAILNIQWQNLDEDSSVRQNFLVSLANLHAKLVRFDFPRFRLLETLTENPWTNPTLAKIMGGEVEPSDKEEVQDYIQQEDPIILQLRVDMMLKENCEEYALNLCNSCLMHPELATDLSLRITQLSLLYKMGHEDKLQEECQRLSIQEALRVIKELNASDKQKELYTVLAQTFMVQNWIRPCDTDTSKELLRMWIRHQLLVDREHDQFKDSIWAMAKLSHSTEQIVIIIDVLREECGDTFLQLYVDMSIFALKVDKGQMETSIKESNMEAAAARRADMASVCAKLSCLCHHTSIKVGKICVLTSFALKPSQESFSKIGTFYGQGGNCCDKCGQDNKREANAINPATLYEVERLLNMLRPDYLNPENTYPHIHVMCRRFLLESLRNSQTPGQKKPGSTANGDETVITQVEGPGRKKSGSNKSTFVFEALSPKDVQDRQALLAKLRMQNVANLHPNPSYTGRAPQAKSSPVSNKSKESLVATPPNKINPQQKQQHLQNQQELYLSRLQQQLEKQSSTQHLPQTKQPFKQQTASSLQSQQVSQIIQLALKKDPVALEQISKTAPAAVVQAIASIMKGSNVKSFSLQQQQQQPQQLNDTHSPHPEGGQSLPTVSTLLRPPTPSSSQPQVRQQPVPRKYPRPQLYAQPIIVSTGASSTMTQGRYHSQPASLEPSQLNLNAASHGLGGRVLPTPSQQQQQQQQRAESLSISKAHVQGVRQFMQSQLSALQTGQRVLPGPGGTAYGAHSARVKTTVELAQQAAMTRELKKHQQQQHKQARLSQGSAACHGVRNSLPSGMPPVIGTMNRQPHQEVQLMQQNIRQQPVPRQSAANLFSNVERSFPNPQTSTAASQGSVLPSSDELLGSITGIDDTIINDLLQDSGLLSNTFPDIEVDVSGEDRGRISSTFGQLAAAQANTRAGSGYHSTQSLSRSMLATLSRVSTSGHTYQAKAETVSSLPQSLQIQHQSQTSSASSSFPVNQQSSVFGQQPPTQGLAQPQTSIAAAEQARMDQINQQMKQEDIPGEMCMDAANNATYRCIICSLAFETLDLLREHVRNVCKPGLQSSSVYTSKIEQDKANSAKAGLETTTVFQCLRCFELCISEAGIKQHRLTCKRVPTIPSDIKKEAAAASANKGKSRSGTSSKHSSVKAETGGSSSSRPHSRNNTSVLSSHSSQKASSAALQSISTGAGVAVKLGAYNAQQIKSEPQAQNCPAYPNQTTTPTSSCVSHAAYSPKPSHVSQNAPPTACLPSQPPSKPPSNISTLVTSLPSSFGPSTQSSSLTSLKHSEMSSPISSFQPPFSAAKHNTSSTISQQFALDQNIKMELPESSSNPSANLPNQQSGPKNESHPDAKSVYDVSSPKYSEISGSGGSKFFKCDLCSQTLCSSSSFINHWKECALRHKGVSKKKVRKEKLPAEPLQGKLLENVLNVIESVASGNFDKSGRLVGGGHEEVVKLRDPCLDQAQDTASSADGDGADSEVSWDSRATFDNVTDSEQDKGNCVTGSKRLKRRNSQLEVISEGQGVEASLTLTGYEKNGANATTNHKANGSKVGMGSEEEDEASLSGSESGSSALQSTREAPPKLRDRKLLKPIQSFINETFISPYRHVSKRLAKVMEENIVSESTTSGAESDEDHLFCRACKKPLQSQRLLLEHYVSKHLQPYTMKIVSDSSSYFCHMCQKTFPTFSLYMKHVPNHSSIITQKMKIFNKSPRMSLHRDRLTNQKGLCRTKKKSLSPKLAKALKSKKAATKSAANRMKRQMLILQGHVPPERLKFINRQRNSFRTSSEDDYSSDASNLMFKSKKPMMFIRGPDGALVRRKRGRPRKDLVPVDLIPEDQVETEESQQTSSSNTADEDYMASEDGNSDAAGSASPPSTRSRKRSGNLDSPGSNGVKRRRHFSDSEGLPQQRKDAFLLEFDTDSNSTTLSVSIQENGCVVPCSGDKSNSEPPKGEVEVNHLPDESCMEKLGVLNKLKVRSLSRRQKERLKRCDLNPSVILDALDLDSLSLQSANSENSHSDSGRGSGEAAEIHSKQSTFLDSYLSYISSGADSPSKQSPSKTQKSLKQTISVSLTDLKKGQNTPKKRTLSVSLTDLKEVQEKEKVQPSEASDIETDDRPSSSQSDKSWKFSVRRCSVNLGQKISLSDIESEPNEEVEGVGNELSTLITSKPIVCLERNAEVESCVISNISTAVVDPNTGSISKVDLNNDQDLNTGSPAVDGSETTETNFIDDSSTSVSPNGSDKVIVQDTELSCYNGPHHGDNNSMGGRLPQDIVIVQRSSSTESISSSSCADVENKGGQDDVVILEASDEEEDAVQDDLEDIVIVVNNDVEDDENDEDVVVNNEEMSTLVDELVKDETNTSKIESKDNNVTTQSLAASSSSSHEALQTNKPDLIKNNGPKSNPTSFIYVLADNTGSKNTVKDKNSLCEEKSSSDVCNDIMKDGQNLHRSDVSSNVKAGEQPVGIEENSDSERKYTQGDSSVEDTFKQQETFSSNTPEPGPNSVVHKKISSVADVSPSLWSLNDTVISTVTSGLNENVGYSKGPISSEENGKKQNVGDRIEGSEDRFGRNSGDTDTGRQVSVEDAVVTGEELTVGSPVTAVEASGILVGSADRTEQDQDSSEPVEIVVNEDKEELTTAVVNQSEINISTPAQRCKTSKTTPEPQCADGQVGDSSVESQCVSNQIDKTNGNHQGSVGQCDLLEETTEQLNETKPEGNESAVIHSDPDHISKHNLCSQEPKEQMFDVSVQDHIGAIRETAGPKGSKSFGESKDELYSSDSTVQKFSSTDNKYDGLEISSSLHESHLQDQIVYSHSNNSPSNQLKTSIDNISKAAYENQLKGVSPTKHSLVKSDTRETFNTAVGPSVSNDSFNHIWSSDMNPSQQVVGNDTALKESLGPEVKPLSHCEEVLSEAFVQEDKKHGVLTVEISSLSKPDFSQEKGIYESANLKDQNDKPASSDTFPIDKQMQATSPIISREASKEEDLKLQDGNTDNELSNTVQQVVQETVEKQELVHEDQNPSGWNKSEVFKGVCQTDDDANGCIPENKKVTKSPSKPRAKAIKNSHLSLAAFIAERLFTPTSGQETDSQTDSSSAGSPQDSPGQVQSTLVLQEDDHQIPKEILANDRETGCQRETALIDSPQDSPGEAELIPVLQEDDQQIPNEIQHTDTSACERRTPNDLDQFEEIHQNVSTNPEEILHTTGQKGLENEEHFQDATSAVGLGLVDYSCSSEENSKDADAVFADSGHTDNLDQPMSLQSTATAEPASFICQSSQLPGRSEQTIGRNQTVEISRADLQADSCTAYQESGNCSDCLQDDTNNSMEKESKTTCNELNTLENEAAGHVGCDTVDTGSISFDGEKLAQSEIEPQNNGDVSSSCTNNQDKGVTGGSACSLVKDSIGVDGDSENNEIKNNNSISFQSPGTKSEVLVISLENSDENSGETSNKESPADQFLDSDYSLDQPSEISPNIKPQDNMDVLLLEKEKDDKTMHKSPSFSGVERHKESDQTDSSPKPTRFNDNLSGNDAQSPTDHEKFNEKQQAFKVQDHKEIAPSLPQTASAGHHLQDKPISKSPSPKKRGNLETSYDTDDGDDLSNFELVIEADTSSRSIVTFPEKRNDSVTPHPKDAGKAGPMIYCIEDSPEGKTAANPRGVGVPKKVYNPSPKKVLSGAKSLRKGSLNQFVWDDDSDEDNRPAGGFSHVSNPREPESQQTVSKALHITQQKLPVVSELPLKRKAVEDSTLDPVNRKRKALREKTETAPFTWDLEDNSDKSNGQRKVLSVKDFALSREIQLANRRSSKSKTNKGQDVKRPNNLKILALFGKEGKTENSQTGQSALPRLNETLLKSTESITKVGDIENAGDTIQVDDEISFKRGSLPSTPIDSPTAQPFEMNTEASLNSVNNKRRKSGMGNINSHSDSRPSPPPERKNGELSPKSQASLRSRHSSVDSNRSGTSTPGATPALKRRGRKGEEAHHSRAGLIKVGNVTSPVQTIPAPGGPATPKDASTHNTRSSEAAVKAYNQKSLRNRGVNPLSGKRHSIGAMLSSPSPRHKTEKSSGQAKTPTSGNPVHQPKTTTPQNKTPTSKPQSKPVKRKSGSLQTPQDHSRKSAETVAPKAKKRPLMESKSEGPKKAKSQSGLVKPKSKTVSSVLKKAGSVKRIMGKASSVSSVVRKAKSVVVNKAKSAASAVRKTKTISSAVRKPNSKNGLPSAGKAKSGSTAAGKTKAVSASKKTEVSLAKKSPKNGNKTETPSSAKLALKRSSVKAKSNSATKKPVPKSAEKKPRS